MTSARLAAIGVFVVGGIVLFGIGLFLIGDRRLMFAERFYVQSEFEGLAGLQAGAPVRVSGMNAGEVIAIAIPTSPAGRFRVRMRVREELHPLVRTNSVASIQTDGIVGNRIVQIEPGSETHPPVANEGLIVGQEPFDFADLLARGRDTIDNVNTTVTQVRTDLAGVMVTVGETAVDAKGIVHTLGVDLAEISQAGRRISDDTSRIVEGIRAGRGTVGKLVNDDELYKRASSIAREAEEAMRSTRQAAESARAAVTTLQGRLSSDEGGIPSIVGDLRHTVASTREAMSNLAENTDALKRNFLFRGYFAERGYYDLDELTVADYRQGALAGKHREPIRIWLTAGVLFERAAAGDAATLGTPSMNETLSADSAVRLDRAMAEVLRYPNNTPLIVEGYATGEMRDEQFLRAAGRATQVRDYLLARYNLSPSRVGIMSMGGDTEGSAPSGAEWDGVALAVWVDRRALQPSKEN
jgi:phospholipid/cholesterol/gamma-HCH transport system substrate-binding protein